VIKKNHILSASQFSNKLYLRHLFSLTDTIQTFPDQINTLKPLKDLTLATLFYEPSTRTRLSFEAAIQNLGGHVISTEHAGEFSSHVKGESLEDTIRVIGGYAQGIILRHPEAGSAERAAKVSDVPIINAGDGAAEHPTQALLDLYSIWRAKGQIDGLKIGFAGDFLYSRTVNSLMTLLANYDVNVVRGPDYSGLLTLDVLYVTRFQKERRPDTATEHDFILTLDLVNQMKEDAIILHPLPRLDEIELAVDDDPRAYYFQQAKNGLFLRMALLCSLYDNMMLLYDLPDGISLKV
jgi:aspartate carbamoyltransferase catalytic subunit